MSQFYHCSDKFKQDTVSITVTIHGHYTSSSCQTMPNIKTQKPKSQSLGVLGVF